MRSAIRAPYVHGGHSLLAAQVFPQIEERLGKRSPVSLLFRAPTIRQLAEVLRRERCLPAPASLNDAVTNAVKNCVPRPYGGRATLFRSRRQRTFSSHDPEMGWGQLSCGGLKIVVIPGDHDHLLNEPFVGVLATKLRACLHEARADD